jgi:hypothetical protein
MRISPWRWALMRDLLALRQVEHEAGALPNRQPRLFEFAVAIAARLRSAVVGPSSSTEALRHHAAGASAIAASCRRAPRA